MNIKKYWRKINRSLLHIKNEESGAVTVIIAASMVLLMTILALALDIGLAYLKTGELQKVVDAAVYSSGRMLPVTQGDTTAINAIKDNAINYANLNGFSNLQRSNVVLGKVVAGKYTDLKVTASKDVEMNFAKIIGVNSITITRSAKTKLSAKSKTTGVVPIGISKGQLDTSLANNQVTHITLKYGSGDSTHGWFGALDLDGKGGGASDYRLWIAQGFPGEIVVGDILLKENGNMAGPTYTGFSARFNACTHFAGQGGCTVDHYDPSCPRVAKVVVYNDNSKFTAIAVGFAVFILEEQSEQGEITGSFVRTIAPGGEGSGEDAGSISDYGLYSVMLSE